MTTTEIRLKCLELAMANPYIQKDVNNQIAQAKIYENYLLGITEQKVFKKEKSEIKIPPYKSPIDYCDSISFEVKNEIVNVPNLLSLQQLKDLEKGLLASPLKDFEKKDRSDILNYMIRYTQTGF